MRSNAERPTGLGRIVSIPGTLGDVPTGGRHVPYQREDAVRRPNPKVTLNGKPHIWIGTGFWSATGGPLMWREYDPDQVGRELDDLNNNGMTVTRSFLSWSDFHPTPDTINEELVARFEDFLNKHDVRGMKTIPTFIDGQKSGQHWYPSWREGRDLYSDLWFVARQAFFIREMVSRFHDHQAITGWLITSGTLACSDRADQGSGIVDPDAVTGWARILIDAVRAGGGHQPVGVGDGVLGVENTGVDNGFRTRALSSTADFIGPHVYRMESDQIRQHLGAGFVCDLLHGDDKPIVIEEFGLSSDFSSDSNAAHYYRQLLHNSLLAGATGWLAWSNVDFDGLFRQDPYIHRPFEMHFGLFDKDGQAKPITSEMKAFRGLVDRIDLVRCSRPDALVVLVASSFDDNRYPSAEADDGPAIVATLRQAYVAAREADLAFAIAREHRRTGETDQIPGLPTDAKLYIVPSTKALTSQTWAQLAELAHEGATVYASYFVGTHDSQRGPWWWNMHGLFGVEKKTRYGLVDPIEEDILEMTFVRDLGDIAAGTTLRFVVAGNDNARCFLPVTPDGAEVVAVDGRRRPALLRNKLQSGQSVLCTYPVEYMAAETPAVNPEDTWKLYHALAIEAGAAPEVTVDTGAVSIGQMVHEDGRRFVWFVNLTDEATTVRPRMFGSSPLVPLGGQGSVTEVSIAPFGVEVLERH